MSSTRTGPSRRTAAFPAADVRRPTKHAAARQGRRQSSPVTVSTAISGGTPNRTGGPDIPTPALT